MAPVWDIKTAIFQHYVWWSSTGLVDIQGSETFLLALQFRRKTNDQLIYLS